MAILDGENEHIARRMDVTLFEALKKFAHDEKLEQLIENDALGINEAIVNNEYCEIGTHERVNTG